jgi:hypothetical protein
MSARAFAGIVMGAVLFGAFPGAADPIDQLLATPPDQLRAAIQQLPREVQDRIRQELQTKSLDQLMAMSPGELQSAIQGLSPATKAQLKAEWASLSPEQKAKLKSLDLKALWQEAVARFAAMGPAEKALVKKLLGGAAGLDSGQAAP